MAITDNKTFGWNINVWQFLGLVGVLVLVVVAIWTDSLKIGYTVMTLALCAFFIVVAFDLGVRKGGRAPAGAAPEAPGDARAARERTAREG